MAIRIEPSAVTWGVTISSRAADTVCTVSWFCVTIGTVMFVPWVIRASLLFKVVTRGAEMTFA